MTLRMAFQQGSSEEAWGLVGSEVLVTYPRVEEEAVKVVSEPELVLRLMMSVVVVVELKLMLCKSSARSSSHGSMNE